MSSAIRTFRGATMRAALEQVKQALGQDAIILGTRTLAAPLGGIMGGARLEITAAPANSQPAPPRPAGSAKALSSQKRAYEAEKPSKPKSARSGESQFADVQRAAELRAWDVPDVSQPRAATGKRPVTEPANVLSEALKPFYERMVRNEVGETLALRILREASSTVEGNDGLHDDDMKAAVISQLEKLLPAEGALESPEGSRRSIAFVGPPGAGKTSTVAKLAAQYSLRARKKVALISLDTYRLATHAQLTKYGELIGVEVHAAQTVAAVREARRATAGADVLLIDTPGIGLRDHGRFARLAALLRAARADELHLVLPATWREGAQQRIVERFAKLGGLRLVLTHLDEMLGVGAVVSAAQRLQLTLSYLSDGQRVPGDLYRAAPRELAEALLSD